MHKEIISLRNNLDTGRVNSSEILNRARSLLIDARTRFSDWHINSDEIAQICLAPEWKTQGNCFKSRNDAPIFNLECRRSIIGINKPVLLQLTTEIGLPIKLVSDMLKNDPKLLVENIKFCLDKDIKLLLRLKSPGIYRDYLLRACLPDKYNRLDNIYLISGIIQACEECSLYCKNIYTDENYFSCELVELNSKRELLKQVGDEAVVGVSIQNSEIDKDFGLIFKFYIERLICTNGMTTTSKKVKKISSNVNLSTNYPDKLPPYPLPSGLQQKIDFYVTKQIKNICAVKEKEYEKVVEVSQRLYNIKLPLIEEEGNKKKICNIIRAMLASSGFREVRGISVEEIYAAYLAEKEDFPESDNTAWILVNAITRYISRLSGDEFGSTNNSYKGHKTGHMLRLTSRLLSPRLNWKKITTSFIKKPQDTPII